MDSNCSHYLVTKGKLNFYTKINNKVEKIIMSEGDSIWVASYTEHGFTGSMLELKFQTDKTLII